MIKIYGVWHGNGPDDSDGEFAFFADLAIATEFAQGVADFWQQPGEVFTYQLTTPDDLATLYVSMLNGCGWHSESEVAVTIQPGEYKGRLPVLKFGGDNAGLPEIVWYEGADVPDVIAQFTDSTAA